MTGRFVAIVGPSGVGKDSLMHAMAQADPRITLARRVITRPANAIGEVFDSVSETEFHRMKNSGEFLLWWGAHDLFYAIPNSVKIELNKGHDVLANLSRDVLEQANGLFDHFQVIALSADRDVLQHRLSRRGRESEPEIMRRLYRSGDALPAGIPASKLDNNGPLEHSVRHALDLLYPTENSRDQ